MEVFVVKYMNSSMGSYTKRVFKGGSAVRIH